MARQRGLQSEALRVLAERHKPTQASTVAGSLGISQAQANNACARLVQVGLARRPMRGVYEYLPPEQRENGNNEEPEARVFFVVGRKADQTLVACDEMGKLYVVTEL